MIRVEKWRFKSISQNRFKIGDFVELYEIWYDNKFVGSLFFSSEKRTIWARISNAKLNKKFYKLEKKFFKLKTYKFECGNYVLKSGDIISELDYWNELDTKMQNAEDIECMAIVPAIFEKAYKDNISKKQIIKDIKEEYPKLINKFGERAISKSIIKIFQFPDLNLKIRFGSYKLAKEKIRWGLFNV